VEVQNRTLIFRSVPNKGGKALTLTYKEKLQSFYPRLATLGQVSEVIVRSWDPTTKEAIEGRAHAGDETSKMGGAITGPVLTESAFGATQTVIVDKRLFSKTEAEQIAKAKYNAIALGFITAEGTAIGQPNLRAGEVVELARLGQRFNGFYYVTAATHTINQKGYLTHFCAQRNAT
jgi:phage protein D